MEVSPQTLFLLYTIFDRERNRFKYYFKPLCFCFCLFVCLFVCFFQPFQLNHQCEDFVTQEHSGVRCMIIEDADDDDVQSSFCFYLELGHFRWTYVVTIL